MGVQVSLRSILKFKESKEYARLVAVRREIKAAFEALDETARKPLIEFGNELNERDRERDARIDAELADPEDIAKEQLPETEEMGCRLADVFPFVAAAPLEDRLDYAEEFLNYLLKKRSVQ